MVPRKHQAGSALYWAIGICFSFCAITMLVMTCMAKDYNTYNSVYAFFGVSKSMQLSLLRLPLQKETLLRLLNLSHVAFSISVIQMALQTIEPSKSRYIRWVYVLLIIQAAVQLFFLDPGIHSYLYLKGIGPFARIRFAQRFFQVLPQVLAASVNLEICLSMVAMVCACFRQPRTLRASAVLQTFFFCGISMVYLFLFRWLPNYNIWISRVASYVCYKSLPVSKPTQLHAYVSIISIAMVVCFVAASCLQIRKQSDRHKRESFFSSNITAADTASRVFCHYLKNELLAQQVELNMLAMNVPEPLKADVNYIIQRNQEISRRLTVLRETIKQQKLNIAPVDLSQLLTEVCQEEQNGDDLQLHLPAQSLWVEGSAYQLKEMLRCLIQNAREARVPSQEKAVIILSCSPLRRYVNLVVSNNGAGIAVQERELIFEPFYTTKSTKSNWGLGLSLCRSIVLLHHGQIWVDEESSGHEKMTSFHILLPYKQHKKRGLGRLRTWFRHS